MKIYLCHNFAARGALKLVRGLFEQKGHQIVSRWIEQYEESDYNGKFALEDFQDIDLCDILIHFADQFGSSPGKGKFIEYGYAYAKDKKLVVIAEDKKYLTSVFYNLPEVSHFSSLIEYIATI